jgi:hypothetical protein
MDEIFFHLDTDGNGDISLEEYLNASLGRINTYGSLQQTKIDAALATATAQAVEDDTEVPTVKTEMLTAEEDVTPAPTTEGDVTPAPTAEEDVTPVPTTETAAAPASDGADGADCADATLDAWVPLLEGADTNIGGTPAGSAEGVTGLQQDMAPLLAIRACIAKAPAAIASPPTDTALLEELLQSIVDVNALSIGDNASKEKEELDGLVPELERQLGLRTLVRLSFRLID